MIKNLFKPKRNSGVESFDISIDHNESLILKVQLTNLEVSCLEILENRDERGICSIELYAEELTNPSRLIDSLRLKGCVIFERRTSYCDKRGQWRHNVKHYTLISKGAYICH